jgi:hypothetical protein
LPSEIGWGDVRARSYHSEDFIDTADAPLGLRMSGVSVALIKCMLTRWATRRPQLPGRSGSV